MRILSLLVIASLLGFCHSINDEPGACTDGNGHGDLEPSSQTAVPDDSSMESPQLTADVTRVEHSLVTHSDEHTVYGQDEHPVTRPTTLNLATPDSFNTNVVDGQGELRKTPANHPCDHVALLQGDDIQAKHIGETDGEFTIPVSKIEESEHSTLTTVPTSLDTIESPSTTPSDPNTLDLSKTPNISDPYSPLSRYNEVSTNGVAYQSYSPKPGRVLNRIVDGGEQVWKAKGEERCVHVKYNPREIPLVLLTVKDENGSKNAKYFEKNGQEWREIKKDEYYKKFYGLKSPVAAPQQSIGSPTFSQSSKTIFDSTSSHPAKMDSSDKTLNVMDKCASETSTQAPEDS